MSRTLSVEEGLQDPRPNPIKRLRHPRPDPYHAFVTQERRQILARSLRLLPAANRRALYLCYVKGLSVREAACILAVNEQTFKARLCRGRRKLARSLTAHNHSVNLVCFQIRRERKENGAGGEAKRLSVPEGLLA